MFFLVRYKMLCASYEIFFLRTPPLDLNLCYATDYAQNSYKDVPNILFKNLY